MDERNWGSRSWQEEHFPEGQLDTTGDAWGIRWRGVEKWRHRLYLKTFKKTLQREQSLNVLDIGCALCDFTNKAWKLNKENQFWGLDTSENAIAWVSKEFPEFEFRVATLPDIPFETNFDVVFCLEVLCYLDSEGREKSLKRIHDLLVPGGTLMFSGVLDGGARHHTKEEVIGLIEQDFEIENIVYHHWWVHRRFEEMMNTLDSAVKSIQHKTGLSADEFRDWCAVGRGSMQVATIKFFRLVSPVSSWLFIGVSRLIKFTLGLELLALMGDWISKVFWGDEKAGEIIVVAKKK